MKTYNKKALDEFIDKAFTQATTTLWTRIQRANTADRLTMLDQVDALKLVRSELNTILDGDTE